MFAKVAIGDFTYKLALFTLTLKLTVFGLFCKQICHQDLSKIAQSGQLPISVVHTKITTLMLNKNWDEQEKVN